MKTNRKSHFIATAASVLVLAPAAFGANGTWDTTATPSSWNTNRNWVSNIIADGSGNTADFSTVNITADTTVNLAVDRTIGNLVFGDTTASSAGSWSLATGSPGGRLTLAGTTPTITVTLGASRSLSISAVFAGTSGFTKSGSSLLILSNAGNTISGAVVISQGNIQLNAAAIENATSLAINGGDLVLATGSANPIGGTISFGGGRLQYNNNPGTDLSGQFSTAANQAYRINTSSSGIAVTYASNLSSSGGTLTKSGSGTLTLSAANSYNGGTTLTSGTLVFGNAAALGSGPVTFSGNSTLQAGGAYSVSNAISIASGVTGTLNTNNLATTLSGALTGSGTLAKSGTGTLTLTGALNNTLSGAIQINEGILQSLDGTSFKNMTGAITVAAGASFNFDQSFTGNNLTNALTLSGAGVGDYGALNLAYNAVSTGTITLADHATISHDFNNATISGSINGTNKNLTLDSFINGQGPLTVSVSINLGTGELIKTGVNRVTLNGTNSYGSALVTTGVLYFQQAAAMGGSGANITIQDNGVAARNGTDLVNLLARVNGASTGAVAFGGSAISASIALDMSGHPSLSLGAMGNFAYSGTITPGGGSYRLGGGGGRLTVSSTLTGVNGLVINDAQNGSVILTGTCDYTGPTIVKAGTLRAHGTLSGGVSVMSGGTLAAGPASGIGSLALGQALTVDGTLSMRIDRAATQKADLLTTPSLNLNGTLSLVNTGAALQVGDTFQLFSVSGTISRNNLTLDLPALDAGLTWNFGGLLANGSISVGVIGNVIGYPDFPELLPSQLQAVRDAGYPSATINPGTYRLPDSLNYQSTFLLSGWSNFTIDCSGSLFTVGKQRAFQLNNCNNVTIKNVTVRARYPSATQGRVLSKGTNPNGSAYAVWKISDGYPAEFATDEEYVPVSNEVRAGFSVIAVDGTTGIIDHVTGDNYNCILTPQGNNTWKVDYPNRTLLPFKINDWLVQRLDGSLSQSHAIFLNNSTNCTIEGLSSQGGGFATFFEIGGGGNRLIGCRVECSPVVPPGGTETPVVSCSADGVHARDAYPGIRIENMTTTGVLLDDCIAIHGVFREVTAVSGNTITVSSLGKLAVGDPVRISHEGGFFAQATCTGILNLGGGSYQLALDQALAVPVGSRVCNPKYDGDGYRIINCNLSGTRSRAIIVKADNGLISGCTIQHSGTAINLGPEYYWNESGYVWNVTIEKNAIANCNTGIFINADGAMGNRNFIIRNNNFGTMGKSNAISMEGCEGMLISGNQFDVPRAAELIRFAYSKDVTLSNNLVAYDPAGSNLLRDTGNVINLQGSANGLLYSGRAYALTNSLSGLLLANPTSNAVGDPAQQYTASNASGRWFLQADGNGHAKIISAANGLVLGVNNSSSGGAPLILETDAAGDGQRWTLKPVGSSTIELVNKFSGLSATVQTTATTETVLKSTSTSAAGQLWTPSFNDYIYATWASATGVSSDPSADDNHNGIINLLEYALPPATTGSVAAGAVMALNVGAQTHEYLTLTCRRRVAATDIAFNVECSTDLSAWQPNAVLVSSTLNPDGTTTEMWRYPTVAGGARAFLRVRVAKTN